ncbi:unnamed protein product [Rotaria socialis]|uniref:AIG1-type G domain-containing protein n=1 Tax=Rotaria socialis TaxID=392032 RepID=A0A821DVX2_9BILA|nr:unnamed protein product [Rotaria socialis]
MRGFDYGTDEDALNICIFDKGKTHKNLSTDNASHVWFQLVIETLLRMKHTQDSRLDMIKLWKEICQESKTEEGLIKDFQENYTPDSAIYWYTRESGIYRILNKALRTEDFDAVYAFRSILTDIYLQLMSIHKEMASENKSPFRVYRGQFLSEDELAALKKSCGQTISMNSFLSTTASYEIALAFVSAKKPNKGYFPVLFEITVDPSCQSPPFAEVSSFSMFCEESEVLFMSGCAFRLSKIESNSDRINLTKIYLELCDDRENGLKDFSDYMKSQMGSETTLTSLGELLYKMGNRDQAESFLDRVNSERSDSDDTTGLTALGFIALDQENYDKATECFAKVLNYRKTFLPPKALPLGYAHNNIGLLYDEMREYLKALTHFKAALNIFSFSLINDNPMIGKVYGNLANVYGETQQTDQCLAYMLKALDIMTKAHGDRHEDTAACYNNLGTYYRDQKMYNEALKNHKKAIMIRETVLPKDHLDIAQSYNNIGVVYEGMNEFDTAANYYKLSLDIKRTRLGKSHSSYKITLQNYEDSRNKMNQQTTKIALFMVGRTQTGKSSFGNLVAGEKVFKSGRAINGVTKECQLSEVKMLTIVDTPGFGTCANDAKVRETIQKTVDRVSKKVDVIFILVFLPCGDLDEQNEMSVYKELTTIFGNAALKSKSIAVLSYADNVEQSSSSIFSAVDQYLNDDNTTLLHFIEKNHGNRYLAVYNQSNNTTYKQEVYDKLMQLINSLLFQ